MKKIKIVHITSSLKVGGAETLLCDLIKHSDANQFEHHVVYFHGGPHVQCLKQIGINTYHIKGLVYLYDPIFFIRLYNTIRAIKPDCIHAQLWAANNAGRIVARLLNIPIVCALHNKREQDGTLRNHLEQWTQHYTSHYVAISPNVAQSFMTQKKCEPASQTTIIPNGVDAAVLRQKASIAKIDRATLGLTAQHFVIGSVGRFVPIKNYDLMLKSFAITHQQHSHARLVLVGLGPLEQQLRAQTKHLGINDAVIFVINQPAYQYYPLLDCFTLTYNKEGISVALLEAMSFGLPSVVADVDPTHFVITHEHNGLLVHNPTPHSVAAAYNRVITHKEFTQRLGTVAQETVEKKFSFKTMVTNYEHLFKQLGTP